MADWHRLNGTYYACDYQNTLIINSDDDENNNANNDDDDDDDRTWEWNSNKANNFYIIQWLLCPDNDI